MPCAASVAENCVAAPNSMAVFRRAASSAPTAPEFAPTADMAWSKSANRFTARPMPAAIATDPTAAALLILSQPAELASIDLPAVWASETVDACIFETPAR